MGDDEGESVTEILDRDRVEPALPDDERFKEVKLSELTKEAIEKMFPLEDILSFDGFDVWKNRFQQFNSEEVATALSQKLIPEYLLHLLSDEQLEAVKLVKVENGKVMSQLDSDTVDQMFPATDSYEENIKRLGKLPALELSNGLEKNFFSDRLTNLVKAYINKTVEEGRKNPEEQPKP